MFGIDQLELALEITGSQARVNPDSTSVVIEDLMLQADVLRRISHDPAQAEKALLGMDVLFKMAITRMAGTSGRGYQEVCDEMLTHARFVLEKARELDRP